MADGSERISKVRGHIFEILIVRWEGMVDMRFGCNKDCVESTRAGWWNYRWFDVITPFRKVVELMAYLEGVDINKGHAF
jgi:hypothetical protein